MNTHMVPQTTGWNRFAWEREIRDSKLTPTDKLVAYTLATYTDRHGECFPHVVTLAEVCGKSVRTVQYSLRNLEADSRIRIDEQPTRTGRYSANRYTLLSPSSGATHCTPRTQGVQPTAPRGATSDTLGVQPTACRSNTEKYVKEVSLSPAHPRSRMRKLIPDITEREEDQIINDLKRNPHVGAWNAVLHSNITDGLLPDLLADARKELAHADKLAAEEAQRKVRDDEQFEATLARIEQQDKRCGRWGCDREVPGTSLPDDWREQAEQIRRQGGSLSAYGPPPFFRWEGWRTCPEHQRGVA